jgi:hypothetical protein
MDSEVLALASTGGATLISLMASDLWVQAKSAFARVLGHQDSQLIASLENELDATRQELLSAQAAGETTVEDELVTEWGGRMARALNNNSVAQEELRALLTGLGNLSSDGNTKIMLQAKAKGNSRVFQQGQGIQNNH